MVSSTRWPPFLVPCVHRPPSRSVSSVARPSPSDDCKTSKYPFSVRLGLSQRDTADSHIFSEPAYLRPVGRQLRQVPLQLVNHGKDRRLRAALHLVVERLNCLLQKTTLVSDRKRYWSAKDRYSASMQRLRVERLHEYGAPRSL